MATSACKSRRRCRIIRPAAAKRRSTDMVSTISCESLLRLLIIAASSSLTTSIVEEDPVARILAPQIASKHRVARVTYLNTVVATVDIDARLPNYLKDIPH